MTVDPFLRDGDIEFESWDVCFVLRAGRGDPLLPAGWSFMLLVFFSCFGSGLDGLPGVPLSFLLSPCSGVRVGLPGAWVGDLRVLGAALTI